MSNFWNNQVNAPGTELSATMTGAAVLIGTLPFNPNKLIFDNQGSASIGIYVNGTTASNLWKTFPGGEALILDQDLSAFPIGTMFYGLGASGFFSIAYTYLKLT
jgi:hypothetical protein